MRTTMLRTLVTTLASSVGAQLIAFCALIMSVRILGNEDNGRLAFAYYFATTVFGIAILGQRSGNIFFVARKIITPSTAFSNALVFSLVVGSAMGGAFLA